MAIGVPDGLLSVMGATPRQILPDNLVQGRIDHDPSVPGGQLGGRQDVGTLDDVRRWQRDGLLDQMPTEGLPLGIPLWISHPGEIGLVLQHLPEVRLVIEAMQRELQLRRQRETVKRSSRSMGYNPITCCAATRWVSTAYGMKRPMRKKTGGAFRPLKRGVPRFSECYPLVISAILLYIIYSNPTSS